MLVDVRFAAAEYATERNDTEAALSPPRTIRSREYCFDGPASVTKIWTRKKRVDVDAATAVGPALLTGPAPREDTPLTTYQAACSGQAVVETAPRRSLVRAPVRGSPPPTTHHPPPTTHHHHPRPAWKYTCAKA